MPTVGPGIREIRVHTGIEHRVLYVARFAESIYVLHAFEKRSRKSPRRDLEIAGQRFRSLLLERRRLGG
jgi:phage-related protein